MNNASRINVLRLFGIRKRRDDGKSQATLSSYRPAGSLEQEIRCYRGSEDWYCGLLCYSFM